MKTQICEEIDEYMSNREGPNQHEIEKKVTQSIHASLDTIVADKLNKFFEGNTEIENTIARLVEERIEKTLQNKNDMQEEKLSTLINTIVDDKLSTVKSPTASSSKTSLTQVSPTTYMRTTVTNVTNELRLKEKRKNNIIIYGIPDSTNTNKKEEDLTKVKDIVQSRLGIPITDSDIKDIHRIGNSTNRDTTKPQPLLITVLDTTLKDTIFKNLYKLRGDKSFSFSHDHTKLERDQHKKLVTEAIDMSKKDKDGATYRVRGGRIVKMITTEVVEMRQTTSGTPVLLEAEETPP